MTIKVLRCYKNNGIPYGEYYVSDGDSTHLVFQNGGDIKIIPHLQGISVENSILKPSSRVVDLVIETSNAYLSTDSMYDDTVQFPDEEVENADSD